MSDPRNPPPGLVVGALAGGPIEVLPTVARLTENRVDQISLAQAPEAVEAKLVGDRVQVGQRGRLQLGAVEY